MVISKKSDGNLKFNLENDNLKKNNTQKRLFLLQPHMSHFFLQSKNSFVQFLGYTFDHLKCIYLCSWAS